MHYTLLVKIRADNAEDALSEAKDQVEQSCGDGRPFDYMSGDIVPVTKKTLKEQGVTNFKALEKKWHDDSLDETINRHKASLKEIFFHELAKRYLCGKEALTYLNYKDQYGNIDKYIQETIEKISKTKVAKPNPPTSLDELAEMIVDMIHHSSFFHMGFYHVESLDKLISCKTFPTEPSITLNCYDCHFADLGGKGKAYYFFFDRHA